MWEQILFWIAKAEEAHAVFRFLGLSKLATLLLQRRGGVVNVGGFQFFPNRAALHLAHGTLAQRFADVSFVSAIWVIGQKFYYADERPDVVRELLLPNPTDAALKHHVTSINHAETAEVIKKTTEIALKKGTKVRWYDHFIFHSIILADIDKPSGWIHIESVLPYSKSEKRPSYTVHKRHSEETVREMSRIFRAIWDASKDAPSP